MDMKVLAKSFGKDLYEKFTVVIDKGGHTERKLCKFTESGLYSNTCGVYLLDNNLLNRLIVDDHVKIKDTWKPKKNETYYTVAFIGESEVTVTEETWDCSSVDYIYFMCGNCFKTKELAEKHKNDIKNTIVSFYDTRNAFDWEDI